MEEITKQKATQIVSDSLICDTIFGIDPGKSNGGIVKRVGNHIETWSMKKAAKFEDLNDLMNYQAGICKLPIAFIENITTYKVDASNIGKMYGLDKLKRHYSELRAILKINKIPFIEIMPLVWMKYLRIYIKNEDRIIRKRRFKDIACEMFPQVKVTLQNCDALLIAEFGRRKLYYDHLWVLQNLQKPEKNKLY